MSKRILLLLSLFLSLPAFANNGVWKDLDVQTSVAKARSLSLDLPTLSSQLENPASAKSTTPIADFELPLPDGTMVRLSATEYSIMTDGAETYGGYRSWKVSAVDRSGISGVVDISLNGFHAMLFMPDGETVFIDPDSDNADAYMSYKKSESGQKKVPFSCGVHSSDEVVSFRELPEVAYRTARTLVSYKLAVAATGEFSQFHLNKGNDPNAEIQTLVGRVNEVYERDLGIRLLLINNNSNVVFLDPNTDPYPVNSDSALLQENPTVLDNAFGTTGYDVGHVVSYFPGLIGGIAALGAACKSDLKGAGVTGSFDPSLSTFAIDYFAHELGHQLGATHTFNSTTGSCDGGNRQAATAYEPGSGSTVMAYAGICGINNIANNSIPYFHIGSIEQIDAYVRTGTGSGCTSPVANVPVNNAPDISNIETGKVVNVGDSFTLTGAATDIDGDTLTYSWDQFDAGTASDAFVDTGDNALFEVIPSNSAARTFPGRAVTNRNLNFKFVVRDGKGGVSSGFTTVSVGSGASPSSGGGSSMNLSVLVFFATLLLLIHIRQFRRKR